MKRKIYTDGNGSTAVLIDGLGHYVPVSEAVALENKIHQLEDQVKQLSNDLQQQKLIHIGFTNEHQVIYATEDKTEAAFYPDSDNECYIPVYMLAVHTHRVGFDSVIYCENLRMKQEVKELAAKLHKLQATMFVLTTDIIWVGESLIGGNSLVSKAHKIKTELRESIQREQWEKLTGEQSQQAKAGGK